MSEWGFNEFGSQIKNWPKDEKGEFESPVFLAHFGGSESEIDMTINLLNAFGIPVIKKYGVNGEFGKLIIGFSATGVDFFVPESMLSDAQNILSGAEPEEEASELQ
jgi:hypothetical protein